MKQLRTNIRRIAFGLAALFLVLILYGGYSLSNYGSRWFSTNANSYLRGVKKDVIPGNILDRHGTMLAGAEITAYQDGTLSWERVYAQDEAVRLGTVHALGDSGGKVSNAVESFMASYLYGFKQTVWDRIFDAAEGRTRQGDTLTLTLDASLCGSIADAVRSDRSLPDRVRGAVVVMNWQTGEVLSLMSFPAFDPAADESRIDRTGQPFFNRATQGMYAPGSAFKIVTLSAALKSPSLQNRSFTCQGTYLPDKDPTRRIVDYGTDTKQGVIVTHGQADLKNAFALSCNNIYAYAAVQMGDDALRAEAMKYGFNENFLFRDIVAENSSYPDGDRNLWEVALTGIGQSRLQMSPLHLCLITAAVANDGVMMEPRLLLEAASSAGRKRLTFSAGQYRRVTDADTARTIRDAMLLAVNDPSGTGGAAAVPGWTVCGKTGSAELDGQEHTNAWFTGFIADARAPYAVTVLLEDTGAGGTYAAPLAGKIFRWLTGSTSP